MNRALVTRFLWLAVLCLLWTSADTLAARVTSQPRNGYQRVNFGFDAPTRLTVSNKGSNVVLSFSSPLKQSPDAVVTALGSNAKSAKLSADGKTLTIALAKPLRTRHFISGTTVGVDFIGATATEATTAPSQAEPTTEQVLTTKKLPEKSAEKAPATPAAPKEEPMLTTKAEPVVQPAPKEQPKPAPVAAAKPEVKPAPKVEPKVEPKPEPKTEPAQVAQPTVEPTPQPVVEKGPFVVTARNLPTSSILNFPYAERTAAAVFERGNSIWIIFSRASDLNVPLLRTVLPKSVTSAEQYSYDGNSVLRLTTDGSVHASAENLKGSYQWNVTLAAAPTEPANAVPINVDTTNGKTRLLLNAFDVAPALKFYDPAAGDLLMVIPSYENRHGVNQPRSFPEVAVLPSNQGIVLTSTRDDLTSNSSRLGVAVESPKGLAISENLAVMSKSTGPVVGNSGVLLPYNEWFVPTDKFRDVLRERQNALRAATKDSRGQALYDLASLYLGRGMGAEALGYLDLLAANEPEFYKSRKLALLSVAAHSLEHHPDAAAAALAAPELTDVTEAELWREYLSLFLSKPSVIEKIKEDATGDVAKPFIAPVTSQSLAEDREDYTEAAPTDAVPTPPPAKPVMRFLKYNRSFIRFYPPRIRQLLASAAADAYIANGLEEKALAAYDSLNRDDIIGPLQSEAEYALALQAIKSKKTDQANELLDRLVHQKFDQRTRARARITNALTALLAQKMTPEAATDEIEMARMGWRGDAVEVEALKILARLYQENKRYDEALRTLKTLVDEFPGEPDFLLTSGELSDLFEKLYLGGLADEMSPLKSLSLFYEFRDLTPIGDKGDLIIQKLADRLAAFDLIDRATQLLENQVNFRVAGEVRSRVGARLALLYLFNHQPQEALKVLEVTNYGNNPPELQRQRLQLTAQALSGLGRHTDGLNMIYNDRSDAAQLLKMDILWAAQDWPNVVTTGEDILSKRTDLTAQLTPTETEVLLKLALGYSFQGDYNQLRYLRDYYAALVPESGYKQIFEFITNDTTPLDREDSTMLTDQISRTESFMSLFKDKIIGGKLSEAIK